MPATAVPTRDEDQQRGADELGDQGADEGRETRATSADGRTAPPRQPRDRGRDAGSPDQGLPVPGAPRAQPAGPPVEDVVDDARGRAGWSAGSRRGTGPGRRPARSRRRGRRPASSRPGPGQLVAGPAAHQEDRVARAGGQLPGRRAAPRPARRPAGRRRRSAASASHRRGDPQLRVTSPACCSCSSCTVHSTSASPPRPSLVCVAGSAPRGSRSRSTRALIRRISATCSAVSPSAG